MLNCLKQEKQKLMVKMIFKRAKSIVKKTKSIISVVQNIQTNLTYIRLALGRIEIRQITDQVLSNDIGQHEFKVFSQWGEDGIIQYLIRQISIENKLFVEFGVEDYTEANTRFLLQNDNWSGLIIDGSDEKIAQVKKSKLYWRHNLKAECAFITRENINTLIEQNGVSGEIGLLSVDIDGNDYWVWQAIDIISPAIVITEYNHRFGSERAVTTPYDPDFVRSQAHYSNIYYGASLRALSMLGKSKGYELVGCNSAGNNAFFVRGDLLPSNIPSLSVEDAYRAASFRESRNEQGQLAFLTEVEEQALLSSLPLVDIEQS